jgi:hypothetical protein
MARHRSLILYMLLILIVVTALSAGCNGNKIDANVATVNALATQVASGYIATRTAAPTEIPNLYALSADPSALLVHAWGQVNGLPRKSEFTIVTTQQQVGDFIIETLKLAGWDETVQGGSVVIDVGQIRLDLALIDANGAFGAGTVSFQPTLDEMGRVKLNPLGGGFGDLKLPNGLTAAFGDAVYTTLAGAPNDRLSNVTLHSLSLQGGIMEVTGERR